MMPGRDSPLPVLLYRMWLLVWSGHALASLGWWWLQPPGFPSTHPQFWSNRVAPLLVLAVALPGLWATWKVRPTVRGRGEAMQTSHAAVASTLAVFPPAAWLLAAVIGWLLFPASWPRLTLLLAGPTVVLVVLAVWLWRWRPAPALPAAGMLVPALLASGLMVCPQRSLEPVTRPLEAPLVEVAERAGVEPRVIELADQASVSADHAQVEVRCGGLLLKVHPLLTFYKRSPDRCWSIMVPRPVQAGPERVLTGWRKEEGLVQLQYHDDDMSTLKVSARPGEGLVEIEALSRLSQPVYSHLNSWCQLTARGEEPLSVAFSPCPEARIPVPEWGDCWGDGLRLAYLDGQDLFHVVQAHQNDKGPFHPLACGRLERQGPLRITLYEGKRAACELEFDDWACQAGQALSPCAGHGLPVNAIEFSRFHADPLSSCNLVLSLAATSVGRGRNTVGHTPGTYRNRMRIRPCDADSRDSTR